MNMNTKQSLHRTSEIFEKSNLTNSQFLFWLGQKLNPEVPLYNMIIAFKIYGEIRPDIFQKAFQALLDRCDALRTVIEEVDGIPQYRVLESFPYELEIIDFSGQHDPQAGYDAWIKQRRTLQFNLATRLFDPVLIKFAKNVFIWYINQHHLITDGWSEAVLYRQMNLFYKLALEEQLAGMDDLPAFQDYVIFEKDLRSTSNYQKAVAYWQGKVAEPVEPIHFYGTPAMVESMRAERLFCDLGRERTEKLKNIALEREFRSLTLDLSLFNVFATVLFAYLHRISETRSLTIGTPTHNRLSKVFKETIGLFIELFPLQIEFSDNETFLSLVKKIKYEIDGFLRYAQPGTSSPESSRAYHVILNFIHASFSDFCGFRMKSEWIHPGYGDRGHNLGLQVHDFDASGSIRLQFDFNREVFDDDLRRFAIEHFLRIVDAFIEDRKQLIKHISILSDKETWRLLTEFNQTKTDYPRDLCIHQLFEAQAERTPDNIAVIFPQSGVWDQELGIRKQEFGIGEQGVGVESHPSLNTHDSSLELTYRELNQRANQLAHHLQSLGVGPEVLVGICVERSIEMVVGMLGILKAGGAYVPLDPTYPAEWLAFMMTDADLSVLLTHADLRDSLPETRAKIVCLDRDWDKIEALPNENLEMTVKPENLAYVLFTSGSTGKPKGVMMPHQALCNHMVWMKKRFTFNINDKVLQKTPVSFDASVWEFYISLISGGQLILAQPGGHQDPIYLAQTIQRYGITTLQVVPTQLQMLLATPEFAGCTALRRIFCGGEPLLLDLCQQFSYLNMTATLYNLYGPTEACIDTTFWSLQSNTDIIPVGVPIDNVQIYILDQNLQLCPVGVSGELHIGGAGLARGYLNRPELTTEKFISNPFGEGRLYKTGDLARQLPDGNIEFIGRIDHQVKIRGFRIELGEIESVLGQHPEVQEVVLMAQGVGSTELEQKRLVAYLIANPQLPNSLISELRDYLQEKLPDYMIPSAFVVLDQFPLTPNGKIDRKALPAPDMGNLATGSEFEPPRTPTEEILANIWAEVLAIEQVGRHDNFFEVGGDSILNIQIVTRAHQAGLYLTPSQIFAHPTVSQLAAVVKTCSKTETRQELVTHSSNPATAESKLSEFPGADLTQEDLDDIIAEFGES